MSKDEPKVQLDELLDALRSLDRPGQDGKTTREIVEATGFPTLKVRNLLDKGVTAGKVRVLKVKRWSSIMQTETTVRAYAPVTETVQKKKGR